MSYDAAVLALSPKIYLKFDDPIFASTLTNSGSLSAYSGNMLGSVYLQQGALYPGGNSVKFAASPTGNVVIYGMNGIINTWSSVTVAGWVQPSTANDPYCVTPNYTGSGTIPFAVGNHGQITSSTDFNSGFYDGSAWHGSSGGAITTATPTFVVFTFTDGGAYKEYINGSLINSGTTGTTGIFSGWTGTDLLFGKRWDSGSPTYSGDTLMAGWAVWDSVLNATQIATLYSGGAGIQGVTANIVLAAGTTGSPPPWISGETSNLYLSPGYDGAITGYVFNEPIESANIHLSAQLPWVVSPPATPDPGGGSAGSGGGAGGKFYFKLRASARSYASAVWPTVTTRPNMNVQLNMPGAAIRNGVPYVPAHWIKPPTSLAITNGTSHGRVIPDPDPVTHPLPSGYTSHTYRWTVSDLTAPGTTPYSLTDWAPHGGTGPHWTSNSTYAPSVRQHTIFGTNDQYHTFTQSLLFDPSDVSHMWMDMGSAISQPFTFMFAGIIHSYPTRRYGHYILDAGKATPALDVRRDHRVADGLSYRSLMLFQRSSAILCTRPRVEDGVYAMSKHNYVPRARVMFGIFNGANSYIGYFDHENQVIKKGRVDAKTHRYFVTGRRTNYVSDNLASHMTLFEIRYFNSALGHASLLANYRQLASVWKFSHYNNI